MGVKGGLNTDFLSTAMTLHFELQLALADAYRFVWRTWFTHVPFVAVNTQESGAGEDPLEAWVGCEFSVEPVCTSRVICFKLQDEQFRI